MYSMLKSKNLIAAIELVGFVAFALILKRVFDPLFWRYAGPVSLIIVLIVLTRYMRMRRETWAGMGLIALPGARAKLMLIPKTLLAFVGFAIAVATVLLGGEVLGLEFMSEIPEGVEDRWGDIKGNLPLYLLWLGIVWTAAAFGEEMFFRGFIITRLQSVFSGVKFASVIAVILAAAFFGYVHMYYQGLRGFFTTGAIGLAFGATFLLMKRNLYPVILVHGIVDTIGFTARFMDWDA
jgi:CAAX protease family protein